MFGLFGNRNKATAHSIVVAGNCRCDCISPLQCPTFAKYFPKFSESWNIVMQSLGCYMAFRIISSELSDRDKEEVMALIPSEIKASAIMDKLTPNAYTLLLTRLYSENSNEENVADTLGLWAMQCCPNNFARESLFDRTAPLKTIGEELKSVLLQKRRVRL